MKKLVATLAALTMISNSAGVVDVGLLGVETLSVSAENMTDSVTTVSGVTYSFLYDSEDTEHKATITGVTNATGAVTIPATLTDTTVPGNSVVFTVVGIAANAFQNNTNITSVTIPDSITSIGAAAFDGCSALVSITVNENNDTYCSIGGVLYKISDGVQRGDPTALNTDKNAPEVLVCYPGGKGDESDESFEVPDSVTTIGSAAFQGNTFLNTVTFAADSALTGIGSGAFYCASITEITLPSTLTTIQFAAFGDCNDLSTIFLSSVPSTLDRDAFNTEEALNITARMRQCETASLRNTPLLLLLQNPMTSQKQPLRLAIALMNISPKQMHPTLIP